MAKKWKVYAYNTVSDETLLVCNCAAQGDATLIAQLLTGHQRDLYPDNPEWRTREYFVDR